MAQDKTPTVSAPVKSRGGRSVNHPGITIEAAVKRGNELFNHFGKNWVLVTDAGKTWGYAEKSSGLRTTVSALKQYGLLQDMGDGDSRKIRLTDRGLAIATEPDASQKRQEAIRAAALAPKIYSDIFGRFPEGLPTSDHAIESYLLREKNFNRGSVDSFIAGFRANIGVVNLAGPANIPKQKDEEAKSDHPEIEVGDLVQWESSGQLNLPRPTRVRAITEHEGAQWVFLDGSETGIPVSELILEQKGTKPMPSQPTLPLPVSGVARATPLATEEREWLKGPLPGGNSYRIIVTGEMKGKEIGKLIKVLEAQKVVLADDEEEGLA